MPVDRLFRQEHPPSCTCVECSRGRATKRKGRIRRFFTYIKKKSNKRKEHFPGCSCIHCKRARLSQVQKGYGGARRNVYQRRLLNFQPSSWIRIIWPISHRVAVFLAVITVTFIVLAAVSFIINETRSQTGAIVLSIIGIVIIIWGLRTVVKKRPGFVRTFMVLLLVTIFISFSWAYLKIQSLDDIWDRVENLFSSTNEFQELANAFMESAVLNFVPAEDENIDDVDETKPEDGVAEDEVEVVKNYDSYIYWQGGRLVGADWNPIILTDNPEAVDPTWQELKDFLLIDKTDQQRYNSNTFVCADFAEMLHNSAESAGIKAAYVCVDLQGSMFGHALNAFQTTDNGLVFVDCTAPLSSIGNHDKTVDLKTGKSLIPQSIFNNPGYLGTWDSMGLVTQIYAYWGVINETLLQD